MKKITILAFTFFALILNSCNSEDSGVQMNTENIITKSLADRQGLLFTYTTHEESADKAKAAFIQLTSDVDAILANREDITHIFTKVRIGDNKGELLEVHYIDEPRNQIVDIFVLNPISGELESIGGGGPVYEPTSGFPVYPQIAGMCPSGYNTIGTCTNSGDNLAYNTCVGSTIAAFHLSYSSVGDVGTYQTLTIDNMTMICGKITAL